MAHSTRHLNLVPSTPRASADAGGDERISTDPGTPPRDPVPPAENVVVSGQGWSFTITYSTLGGLNVVAGVPDLDQPPLAAAASPSRRLHATPSIAHEALWQCIHHLEAGDWHNEDTGHNGHYGGLQMSYGWDGLVTDAARLSPLQQMTAAETGYRQSGYSRTWLMGQWYHPQCLGYA